MTPPKYYARRSDDSAWPLRNAEGLTFAEAKRRKIAATLAERSKEQSNG